MDDRALTITNSFLEAVENYPDNVLFHFFHDNWVEVTYREFAYGVRATASYLADAGLITGDRVAIISENRPEWCSAYLSIIMAGGTAVPVDSQLGPDEIRNLFADSEAKTVFHSSKMLPEVAACIKKFEEEGKSPPLPIDFDSALYGSIVSTAPRKAFPEIGPEEIASIIYTSGTTGNPKGVMLTQKNFCSDAGALIGAGVISHEDNVLSILPLHHTYAFMCTFLVPVFLGASITYPASLKGPDLMSAIKGRGVSVLIGVPQLLDMIRTGIMGRIGALPAPVSTGLMKIHRLSGLLREKFGLNIGRVIFRSAHEAFGERFRFFGSGGAKLDPAIMKDLEALGFTVVEGYGLTETSPVVTFNPVSKRKAGSAGKALPSVEIRIIDPSESGEGEIAIRGPMVMKGYYRNPSATADSITDGWFRTGDIGRLDRDGYLFITGRSKEVIVLGSGKNIYPEEVEKLYVVSPLVREICVFGREHKGMSESLQAVIVPDLEYARQARVVNIQDAIKWDINEISGRMPSYMRIAGFSLRTEPLPRTPLGKIRRFIIREGAATGEKEIKKGGKTEEEVFSDDTARKVAAALRQFVKEGEAVSEEDNLELDIGLDSLSKIELVVELEKIFSLTLPEDFMSDIQTVRELIEKIKIRSSAVSTGEVSEKTGWGNILSREPSDDDLRMISFEPPGSRMTPAFLVHAILRILFKLFFRLEARGIDNIPLDRNFILAPNHTSYLDGFVLILSLPFPYFKNIYLLGLKDFFSGFVRGRLAKMAHVIPIDSASYLNKALQMSAYVLKKGHSLSVFPEGGRSSDGGLMEFKKGVGILAVELKTPVVPVFIKGAFEALPRDRVLPGFRKISVTFGRPVRAADIDFSKKPAGIDEYQYFADLLRERVKELSAVSQD